MTGAPTTTARIEPWGEGDLPLLHRLLGDPAMTAHIGGAETPQQIDARHLRYLARAHHDPVFRVVDTGSDEPVGWVGYWQRDWCGEPAFETGWSVLPEFQGRGFARAATALLIDAARRDGRRRFLHAFPSVGNVPSNALCRRLGFSGRGAVDFEYPPGQVHRSIDWRLDLAAPFVVRPTALATGRPLRQAILRPHETLAELAAHEPEGSFAATAYAAVGDAVVAAGFVAPDGEPGGWRIRGMATAPEARGQGAGSAILEALVAHALEAGATRIWCNARTPAISLYARAGFAVTSAEFQLPSIGPHVVMERGR